MQHEFRYISKHDPEVKAAYQKIIEILHKVQDQVRNDFTFQFTPVGSYSRNMITYDAKGNVGFDFDFNIEVNDEEENFTAEQIKTTILKAMQMIVPAYGFSKVENSTRVITIKKVDFFRSRIVYSCDFAIIYNGRENGKPMQQYIHFDKTAQTYMWCRQSRGYHMLPEKIEWLKDHDLWAALREYYLDKKNGNPDPDVHSRTIFAIAVQEMCQKHGYYR